MATERWLAARRAEVLPIPYFHVVFTLPHALNPLAQSHPRLLYRLLFESAASTLLRFGRDPRHLGGDVGVTAVLHTWSQNLGQHLHVHCVVTGGALAPDGTRWIPARSTFLFPVRALAQVFRGRYLARLQRAFDRGQVHCTGGLAPLAEPAAFAAWLTELRQSAWVVYCKPPFAGPDHVLAYLGRYTHRVALSNHRLVAFADGRVRFRWRDADADRVKIMDLGVDEFLRRFLLHIVPDRFVRIRHFGLLANRRRRAMLAQCRTLLACLPPPPLPKESVRDLLLRPHRPRHRALPRLPAGPPPSRRHPRPDARSLGHLMSARASRPAARRHRRDAGRPPARRSQLPTGLAAAPQMLVCTRLGAPGSLAPSSAPTGLTRFLLLAASPRR